MSDISDIEDTDYCDDSETCNIEMKMKLQGVKLPEIKQLYNQSDQVLWLYHSFS